ncbi:MAG: MBL fold metallo-hydrolase [Gemmataceae bacterium]
MAATIVPLASGSRGNSCLLESGDGGILVDVGLGSRQIARRLAAIGRTWSLIRAVVLTHTHGDHWTESALSHCVRLGIEFHCHSTHADWLRSRSPGFRALTAENRVRLYAAHDPFSIATDIIATPRPVSHDSHATFAFRFDGLRGLFGPSWSFGYAADLGVWDNDLVDAFSGVDVLALEFNHDERLQLTSRRSPALIRRVMGDEGHLSNRQASEFVEAFLGDTAQTHLQSLIALHLSQECNRPTIAAEAARLSLTRAGSSAQLIVATQDAPSDSVSLGFPATKRRIRHAPRTVAAWPGLYDDCA